MLASSRRSFAVALTNRLRQQAPSVATVFSHVSCNRPAITASTTSSFINTNVRSFHSSSPLYKLYDTDDEEDPDDYGELEMLTMDPNQPELTQEEMRAIVAEEEANMKAREEAKYNKNYVPNRGMRKRPITFGIRIEDFERELLPQESEPWTYYDRRCGALAIKVGMMPLTDEWAIRRACTVLLMDKNIVMGHKTMEKHGYSAVQVAAGERKRKRLSKTIQGQYKHIFAEDEHVAWTVREFRVSSEDYFIPIGQRIHARHFVPGQNIDVSGITKGKGFQGAMKRHGFGGMPASHGVSLSHRALGSTGQCQDPGKVFKGKKMAGRMGGTRVTVQNQRILKIDRGRNLIYIEGHVPGQNGCFVEIKDAVKKPLWRTEKVVGNVDRPPLPTFAFEEFDGCGEPGHIEMMPTPEVDPLLPYWGEEPELGAGKGKY
jgi:large subunit ribosomal protein L3